MEKPHSNPSEYLLKDFLHEEKNQGLISLLRRVKDEIGSGLARSNVFFVRVKASNANSNVPFKEATIDAEVQRNNSNIKIIAPYAIFFMRGYATLAGFLDERNPTAPQNLDECQALGDLLQFLLGNISEQNVLTKNIEDEGQGELMAALVAALPERVVQHLLEPLAPHKTFGFGSFPGLELRGCGTDEDLRNGDKGNTSFGCRKGWHGRADIMIMGEEIPFTIVEAGGDVADPDNVSTSSDSSFEINGGENFTPSSLSQITAQTIVSSFIHKRRKPKSLNSMVPGIGISSKQLIVTMYDCEDDILVSTGPLDLHAQLGSSCNLNLRAIIILWLALNHSLFGNKTPEKYKQYTAEFHKLLIPGQLEAYKNESEHPFNEMLGDSNPCKYLDDLSEEASCYFDDILEHMTSEYPSVSLK